MTVQMTHSLSGNAAVALHLAISSYQRNINYTDREIAFVGGLGQAIDAYAGEIRKDDPLETLRSSITDLSAKKWIPPETWRSFWEMLEENHDVVEQALRSYSMSGTTAIGIEKPFDPGTEWCWIPRGRFQMGSTEHNVYATSSEKPQAWTLTCGFFMLNHPITVDELGDYLWKTGRHLVPDIPKSFMEKNKPVVNVSQILATEYAIELGKQISKQTGHALVGRLPTEAEWEKAARGKSGNENTTPATAQTAHFRAETTREVNSPNAQPNEYGLYDMAGLVGEWTSSTLPNSAKHFIVRGGSWRDWDPAFLRAAFRGLGGFPSHHKDIIIGFRPILIPQNQILSN